MYESKVKYYYGTGRRKHSVARVRLYPGNGTITINGRGIDDYFGLDTLKLIVRQPLALTENLENMDVVCTVTGGGVTGQAGAIRHGVARALLEFNPELRPVLKKAGFLTRDPKVNVFSVDFKQTWAVWSLFGLFQNIIKIRFVAIRGGFFVLFLQIVSQMQQIYNTNLSCNLFPYKQKNGSTRSVPPLFIDYSVSFFRKVQKCQSILSMQVAFHLLSVHSTSKYKLHPER